MMLAGVLAALTVLPASAQVAVRAPALEPALPVRLAVAPLAPTLSEGAFAAASLPTLPSLTPALPSAFLPAAAVPTGRAAAAFAAPAVPA
ncbi:MAG: hypothetical protein KGL53_05255, partial [Elusimicrobia bacterium]|nr:hypothetical protein [Elusimicrobiota bacterium]